MIRQLLIATALLSLGACSDRPVTQKAVHPAPGCTKNPEMCIGGYLIRTDFPGPRRPVYKISDEEYGNNFMSPSSVDQFVEAGMARFYWPEDEDLAGRKAYEDLVRRQAEAGL